MSKQKLEDMVKTRRPQISESELKKNTKVEMSFSAAEKTFKKEIFENTKNNNSNIKNRSRFMLWFMAVVSVGFCVFAISLLLSKAEIVINPKTKDVMLNENFSASKDSNMGDLSFDLVVISGEENKIIQATAEKDVQELATGAIVIYNKYSSSSQTLSINTRLEGSNGKIYQTLSKIVVPGKSKAGTPGSIEAKISAAQAGEEYNSGPLDFKILGFKGTSKYAQFYGRSKGAIIGGFKGKAPAVTDADKLVTINELKSTLQKKLLQKATDQIPGGFVLFKNAIFLNTDDSDVLSTYNNDGSMTLSIKATLYGFLLNEQKLTAKIVKKEILESNSDIYISNLRDLKFSLPARVSLYNKDNVTFADTTNIDFNLSGSVRMVWKTDIDKFIGDMLGKSKKDFNQILTQYEGIDSANLTLTPAWKMSIPEKIKDIKVLVNYPK